MSVCLLGKAEKLYVFVMSLSRKEGDGERGSLLLVLFEMDVGESSFLR